MAMEQQVAGLDIGSSAAGREVAFLRIQKVVGWIILGYIGDYNRLYYPVIWGLYRLYRG